MGLYESVDSFVMQLVIVPLVVIGLGVLSSVLTKKTVIGPLITLGLNLLYEIGYSLYYYPGEEVSFTIWNIILTIVSFSISYIAVSIRKPESSQEIQA
ncbi:DUF2651 family protein [Bacillus massiliglaciei]|uniref:DUF2651 family protein n=1 Tax=Bacillus massiliglaciei TaxID=1816693 RepID=UPI000DA5F690|nr:DUF2651 family protein [Bacillus massiliglaciei]